MSPHISLYRKYRPSTFEEVVGQDHVTRTLTGAIATGQVSHAYLFAGSRGTGKTSTAKLLAKAMNCTAGPTASPCGECESCRAIGAGSSMDVIEMDAASNRGIDDIRDIRDKVAFATVEGKYRIYILDEAHMLTKEASNSFLKILEEPPAHVIFVLCTTEAHKVLATIRSRCQCFEFRRPDAGMILQVLKKVADAEEIEIDDTSLAAIARGSGGAFRDAIGALDQLSTYSGKKISLNDVLAMLGTVESELLFEAADIVAAGDTRGALLFTDRLAQLGRDLGQFSQELTGHLRNIFLIQQLEDDPAGIINAPEEDLQRLKGQARMMTPATVLHFVDLLTEAYSWIRQGSDPRLQLELAFVKATQPQVDTTTRSMVYRLEQLEQRLREGGHVYGAAATGAKDIPVPDKPADSTGFATVQQEAVNAPQAVADSTGSPLPTRSTGDEAVIDGVRSSGRPGQIELSLDKLTRAWSIVLDQVKQRKIPLYSVLLEGRPIDLKGKLLTIGFPAGAAFHKSQVEKQANLAVVIEVLKEMTGAKLVVKCTVAEDAAPHIPPVLEKQDDVPSTEDVIAMIKDEFSAEEIT